MKVIVERTGGFAGVSQRGESDGSDLTNEQIEVIKTLMETPFRPDHNIDGFTYRIELDDGVGIKKVTVPESKVPPFLKQIIT